MTNTNPNTGIRYGVIAFNNIDPDLGQELWYTHGRDLTYEGVCEELRAELRREWEGRNETVAGNEAEEAECNDYVEEHFDHIAQDIQIDEPVIEGEFEGVKYRIDWLGGAPLLWVLEGPLAFCRSLCSPCVPNAADLDSGFELDSDLDVEVWRDGYMCYGVPRGWLRADYDSEGGEA